MKIETRLTYVLGLALLQACSFDSGGVDSQDGGAVPDANTIDAGPNDPDANRPDAPASPPDASPPDAGPDPITEDVVHVGADAETAGHAELVLSGTVAINTTDLTFDGNPPSAHFDTATQDGEADIELAILHVKTLTVLAGADVRVTGSRPLVVIASGDIIIAGLLDAGARRAAPGAGGDGPGAGDGAGGDGVHITGTFRDSGGGGAGHNVAGGVGGSATCNGSCTNGPAAGGSAGASVGDPAQTLLRGGSGGGAAVSCVSEAAGAGGGAVQLYSGTSITIALTGAINVGGGGGGGGSLCVGNHGAGAGGGSGGAIFLQSPSITHAGNLAANGGGGGSGAGEDDQNVFTAGNPGADGALGTGRAAGGAALDEFGAGGGRGGAGASAPESGGSDGSTSGNGGGGGGSVGRIKVITHASGYTGAGSTNSPSVVTDTY